MYVCAVAVCDHRLVICKVCMVCSCCVWPPLGIASQRLKHDPLTNVVDTVLLVTAGGVQGCWSCPDGAAEEQ